LEEYIHAFEEARYATILHNPEMGETFFVSQFVKGLKGELQGHVLAQLPRTVDRAILLAQIQQEVVEMNRAKFQKKIQGSKVIVNAGKGDTRAGVGSSELAKERQLRDFRRLNGLCFGSGEKYEPGHQAKCPKGVELNYIV
jgi:hypothetical protein